MAKEEDNQIYRVRKTQGAKEQSQRERERKKETERERERKTHGDEENKKKRGQRGAMQRKSMKREMS